MANIKEINNFKEEFRKKIELNKKQLNFEVKGLDLKRKQECNLDLSELVTCSENYYEDMIKVYSNNEYAQQIKANTRLEISGTGILYLIVEQDCILELDFEDVLFSAPFVKILVKKNANLNLVEYSNSVQLYKSVHVIFERNASMRSSQFIMNSKMNETTLKLRENSVYDLKSAYFLDGNSAYILNKSVHIGKNSSSNMSVNGAAINNARVINDGLIKIGSLARNSSGHQNMKGLLLDKKSHILSEPVLEIENNDVKCSHGSSISQVNEEVLFYMNSRGISNYDAVKLIVGSFFNNAAENISDISLKEVLLEKIDSVFDKK